MPNVIPEDLRTTCPLCNGSGWLQSINFRSSMEMDSGAEPQTHAVTCRACNGKGWLWALDQAEMAERISALMAACTDYFETLCALLGDKPLPNGEWPHLLICSGDRRKKPGTKGSGCCCRPYWRKELYELQAEAVELKAELDRLKAPWHTMDEKPEPYVWVIVSDLHPEPLHSSRLSIQDVAIVDDHGEWCTMQNGRAIPFSLINRNLRWRAWEWPVDALTSHRGEK
jgi:hypothetical protein